MLKILLLSFFLSSVAHARIFNVVNDTFAVYLRGSLDSAPFENTLASESAGTLTEVKIEHEKKISGELGVVFTSPQVNFRMGLDFIRPPEAENVKGIRTTDSAEVYTMKSEMSVLAPKISLEANLRRWPQARLFMSAGYGYALLTAMNSYSITDSPHFSGLTDFKEELTATGTLLEGTLGYENLLADTTTFVLEAGYRSLKFPSIDYRKATTNFQGSVSGGQPALKTDGSARELDLSGVIFAFSFRFWM